MWVETAAEAANSFQPLSTKFSTTLTWKEVNERRIAPNRYLKKPNRLKLLIPKWKQLRDVTSTLTTHSLIASAAPATTWGQWTSHRSKLLCKMKTKLNACICLVSQLFEDQTLPFLQNEAKCKVQTFLNQPCAVIITEHTYTATSPITASLLAYNSNQSQLPEKYSECLFSNTC